MRNEGEADGQWNCRNMAQHCGGKGERILCLDDACFQSSWFQSSVSSVLLWRCCAFSFFLLSIPYDLRLSSPLHFCFKRKKVPSPSIHLPSTLIVGVIETSLSTKALFRLYRISVLRDDDTANFCSHVGQPFPAEFEPGFQPASRIARLRVQIRMETRRLGAIALVRTRLLGSCCALSVSPFHFYSSSEQKTFVCDLRLVLMMKLRE